MRRVMKDAEGRTLRVGDAVRVIGVPDLTGMQPDARAESESVFRYLVGKYERVAGMDKSGNVEITFRLKADGKWIIHWVTIEPHLLRKRGKKNRDQ